MSVWSALAGLALLLLLALAPTAGARATGVSDAAAALRQGPVYVDPGAAGQLSTADAKALAQKIKDADKPLFVAVLPANAQFPPKGLIDNLRAQTGVAGLYAVRLGDRFDAGVDPSVMSPAAVQNLVTSVRAPDVDAATELNNFADQALPAMRGHAPSSWGATGEDSGVPVAGLVTLGAVVVAGGAGAYAVVRRNRLRKETEERAALDRLRVVVDEDITAFGEELERLDFHPAERGADDAMRGDYERALDSYDRAKSLMGAVTRPHEVRGVTEALEDGRFSLAVLAARRESRPLPERRPPCFFDPRHGPAADDRTWTPAGGAPARSRSARPTRPASTTASTPRPAPSTPTPAAAPTGRPAPPTAPGPAATSAAACSPASSWAPCSAPCSPPRPTPPSTAAATSPAATSARATSARATSEAAAATSAAAGDSTGAAGSRDCRSPSGRR